MIFTVKLDKKNNFLLDKSTGEILDRYDPTNENLELNLKLKDSELKVEASSIIQEYGGQIVFQYFDDKYIIDDGYQDTLVKCGYIVYRNYDNERIDDNIMGNNIREAIIDKIREAIGSLPVENVVEAIGNETEMQIKSDNYQFKFRFDPISNIVTKNYKRKDNNLTYYPFDKSMDKYGTIYVSIFAQKIAKGKSQNLYSVPAEIIKDLIRSLGPEYHYVSLPIKKGRVLYWSGL